VLYVLDHVFLHLHFFSLLEDTDIGEIIIIIVINRVSK
jgi:hypothetical protein